MQVTDYFKELSYGLLSNLSMSGEGSGDIVDAQKNRVVGYMNDALMRIYSRFSLRERDVVIRQYRHITQYHLDKRYAMFNDERPEANKPYILDLPAEQFVNDAIKILKVYDEFGQERVLNDSDDPCSLFTPYPTTLQVLAPEEGRPLGVCYQAKHEELPFNLYTTEVELPTVLEEPFKLLIAHYVFSHMNTADSSAKAQEHMLSYETVCLDIEMKGAANIGAPASGRKFEKRGWC